MFVSRALAISRKLSVYSPFAVDPDPCQRCSQTRLTSRLSMSSSIGPGLADVRQPNQWLVTVVYHRVSADRGSSSPDSFGPAP